MGRYSRVRAELDKLRVAAEHMSPEEPLVVLYDVSYLRALPEEQQQGYLNGLIEAKRHELAARAVGFRGRQVRDEGAAVMFPLKGSYSINIEDTNE